MLIWCFTWLYWNVRLTCMLGFEGVSCVNLLPDACIYLVMLVLYSKLGSHCVFPGFAASALQGLVRVALCTGVQLLLRCIEYRQNWQPCFSNTVRQLQSTVISQRHRQISVHGLCCSVSRPA